VILFFGSISSILVTRSLALPRISLGMMYFPSLTLPRRARIFSSSKGSRPEIRAKRMTPHDQMSEAAPLYALP
jgi:hypothetical protein